jgi:predicted HAD superfamily phosphohydrolase YqeG
MLQNQFATLRQSLPRIGHLITQLRPTYHLDSVSAIDAEFLRVNDIRAVLWDVDGTVMAYHAQDVDPQFRHVRTLFRDGAARHAILSNCDERRFEELGEIFPEVPLLRGYTSEQGSVFRRKLGGRDTHTAEAVEALLAAGGRQIRKPSGELIRYGMEVLDVDDAATALMVGDQYLTDVASANLAGAKSAKVKTFRRDTFPRDIQASQRIEQLLYVIGSSIS